MKSKGLLIATVVLLALSGALYWSNHHPPADDTAKASLDAPPKILTLKQEEITKLSIKKKDGEEVALSKNDSGKWQITAPNPLGADQEAVSSLLSTVSSLNSERLVDDKPADVAQFGLTKPELELNITEKDNKPHKLLIGDNTPAGSAVFAKLEGDPRVFTIASYNKTSIDKSANDLRDKRLLTTDFEKVSQIDLVTGKQSIQFGRNKQEWQIVKPRPLRADNSQVEDLVRSLRDAKLETVTNDAETKKIGSEFASATLVGTAKVTDTSATQQLELRKKKDTFYAKSSAVAGVYKVGSDLGTSFNRSLDDFRNKKLFDFGYDDPSKVEVHDGAKAYFLTKGGQDWWGPDSKKMDAVTVQALIDKVRSLTATKFAEKGFTSSVLDMTVTSNEGKRLERVQIGKSGELWIGKRENDASLYEIDSNSITELQKAAGDLKPAEAAKPVEAPKKK